MVFNAEKYPDEPLTKIGVTEFLATKIKAGDGKNLFCKVYPPFKGIREVQCELHQFAQAHSYVKVAHGEITRNMDEEAMMLVFKEPDSAVMIARSNELWEPHFRATTIKIMPIDEKDKFETKKARKGNIENKTVETKSVTTSSWPTLPSVINTNGNNDNYQTSTMTSSNGYTGVSVQDFEAYKIETAKRMNEIQNSINSTAQTTNQNTESLKNMDERIKNISKSVVNIDDRLINVEKAISGNTASTNENYSNMMQAMANFSSQMDQNNQAVAYLLSVVNPNLNQKITPQIEQVQQTPTTFLGSLFGKHQNNIECQSDQTMSEQYSAAHQDKDEHYTRNIDKQDYKSGSMTSQKYIS
jgi:hypothetical protein